MNRIRSTALRAMGADLARSLGAALLGAALLLAATPLAAHGEGPATARLSYPATSPRGCPDEQMFRDMVAGRLGRDPFRPDGALRVEARFIRRPGGLLGSVRAVDPMGAVVGERDIEARAGECAALAGSMAIAISILLDPLALGGIAPAEETPAPPPPEPPPLPPEPTLSETAPAGAGATPSDGPPVALALHGGFNGGVGLAPSVTFGPAIGAGARIDRVWLAVEGRLDTTGPSPSSLVEVTTLTAGPAACLDFSPWLACAAVHFGAYHGRRTDIADGRLQTTFVSVADARVGRQWSLAPRMRLRLLAELRAPLVRTTLTAGEATVWRAPALAGGLRLELAASFR